MKLREFVFAECDELVASWRGWFVETVEVKITRLTVVFSFVKPATAVRAGQFGDFFGS